MKASEFVRAAGLSKYVERWVPFSGGFAPHVLPEHTDDIIKRVESYYLTHHPDTNFARKLRGETLRRQSAPALPAPEVPPPPIVGPLQGVTGAEYEMAQIPADPAPIPPLTQMIDIGLCPPTVVRNDTKEILARLDRLIELQQKLLEVWGGK
jgi:hypothetical protein